MNCKNCNSEITHNYCGNCGQSSNLKRIDGKYIIHEIEHVLHFERGILYTIKELVLRPGIVTRTFITENRSRLVKPIIFIIITSLIYSIVNNFFHIDEGYVSQDGLDKFTVGKILKWCQGHYGYFNILTGIFIAFWLKLFFKKYNYNFYEILIMLCFALGITMLIFAVFGIAEGLLHNHLFSIAGIIGVAYLVWAAGSFFDSKKPSSYIKALASYILGMISFMIVIFIIGFTIDFLIKK